MNRCDVCGRAEVLTIQDPDDQKFRCNDCTRFQERLTEKGRALLRSLKIDPDR